MTTTCTKCPSTATHYPRVFFQEGTSRMGILLDTPRCEGHRLPLVEALLNRHEIAVYTERFRLEYGKDPDVTKTRVVWLLADAPDVVRFLRGLEAPRAERAKAEQKTPIVVEVVPDDVFAELVKPS